METLWFGTLKAERSETLTGGSDLTYPSDLAVDSHGVWVTDTGNDRVVVLDHALTDSRAMGRSGSGPGELEAPMAIVATDLGTFVSELGNSRISRFDASGQYLGSRRFPNRFAHFAVTHEGTMLLPGSHEGAPLLEWRDGDWSDFGDGLPGAPAEGSSSPEYQVVVASDSSVWVLDDDGGGLWRFDADGSLLASGELPPEVLDPLVAYRDETVAAFGGPSVVVGSPLTKGMSSAGAGRVFILHTLQDPLGVLVSPDATGEGFVFQDVRIREGVVVSGIIRGLPAVRIWRDDLYLLSPYGLFVLGPG
jgi:DNA-binding beta-propeller fold protein YncE